MKTPVARPRSRPPAKAAPEDARLERVPSDEIRAGQVVESRPRPLQPMRSDHGDSLFLSPGNTSVSDLCHTGSSRAVSTLKPYSYTRVPPNVAPSDTNRAITTDKATIPIGVTTLD